MVFQSFNLFPHMSVLDNVTIGLRTVRRTRGAEAERSRVGPQRELTGGPPRARSLAASL